jgi:hypothetical protein
MRTENQETVAVWGDEHVDSRSADWLETDTNGYDSFFNGREGHRVTQPTSVLIAATREALGWSQRELARRMIDWAPSPAQIDDGTSPARSLSAKVGTVLQRVRRFEAGEVTSLKVNDLAIARDVFIREIVARQALAPEPLLTA